MKEFLITLLKRIEITEPYAEYISLSILFVLIFLLSYLTYIIFKPIIISLVTKATKKSKTNWDDILLHNHLFHRIALLIPAIIVDILVPYVFERNSVLETGISTSIDIYIVMVIVSILTAFLNAVNTIFSTTKLGQSKSIKGYIQVGKIIIFFIAAIVVFSILTGKDALAILAGLGAFAAVLLLIFQDAIKGLVSGIQISANDMIRIGDWVSVPKYGADGNVIEIALTTIKIQNWDKTISMIPSYALVSESFSNWRGMEESGGRRIKRSIYIDVSSIHFLSEEEKNHLLDVGLLENYIKEKDQEITQFNTNVTNAQKLHINGRRLTNIGVFRKYLEEYLRQNNQINHNMTFMVRQLQSSEKGLPIEIYAFSKIQSWIEYEGIQSDIFDHIFAAIPAFNLRIFQNPTGKDFQSLGKIS